MAREEEAAASAGSLGFTGFEGRNGRGFTMLRMLLAEEERN
jgi:hypothetical protein